jgi:ABC-2 type transport system ATP-binding protein
MAMSPSHTDVILSLRGLRKSYGDLLAVRNLSLDIFRGEIFGLLGPNGAGKTTTINMVCGLLKADAGEVFINSHSLTDQYQECKHRIGLCPQDLVIWESLTCLEQLELIGRLYDLSRNAARKKALELLKLMGLFDRRHKLAKTLSGGMKRRLNIALALVHNPEILILDEPQAGLDPQSRILVREFIRSLSDSTTVILCTHDMDEADRLADRIAIIDHGQLLFLDTPEGLKNQIGEGDILVIKIPEGQEDKMSRLNQTLPENVRKLSYHQGTLRLVSVDILNLLPLLLDRFQSIDLQIQDMTIREKTLEDVFIALTGRRLRE